MKGGITWEKLLHEKRPCFFFFFYQYHFEVNVDFWSNGCRITTPLAFRLVSYKPHFLSAMTKSPRKMRLIVVPVRLAARHHFYLLSRLHYKLTEWINLHLFFFFFAVLLEANTLRKIENDPVVFAAAAPTIIALGNASGESYLFLLYSAISRI